MKYLKIVFIALIPSFMLSQNLTFDKTYPAFGIRSESFEVIQDKDGYVYSAGKGDSIFIILKTDYKGEVQNYALFPGRSYSSLMQYSPLTITSSNEIVAVYNEKDILKFLKLDSNLQVLNHIVIDDTANFLAKDIIELANGHFLILASYEMSKRRLYELDSEGALILTKDIEFPISFSVYSPILSAAEDSTILIGNAQRLVKLDNNYNIIWQYNMSGYIISVKHFEDGILVGINGKIIHLDHGGNFLGELSLNGTIDDLEIIPPDTLLCIVAKEYVLKSTLAGTEIWKIHIDPLLNDLFLTNEGNIVYSGQRNNLYRVLKSDPYGYIKDVEIQEPNQNSFIAFFKEVTISWYSINVSNISIFYSIDDNLSWLPIVENYPADSTTYSWSVPNVQADTISFKIIDANDESVFNISDKIPLVYSQNEDYIHINNIKMWLQNNGISSNDPATNNAGFYWFYNGESGTAIYQDGLIWGGKVQGEIRLNGSIYRTGLTPGNINSEGIPGDPEDPKFKIYKIRKDWESLPQSAFKDRLEYDYNHWPVEFGADWIDTDNDGIFTQGIDTPKYDGDETMFFVANDLDTAKSKYAFFSDPTSVEMQSTTFGFNRNDDLSNVVFKKYTLINKGSETIKEMYVSYWADCDLGYSADDFVGCDTTLDMGYTYNGAENDAIFGIPPAVSHMLLRGPLVDGADNDSAFINGRWIQGKKTLGMTTFSLYVCGSSTFGCPPYSEMMPTFYYNNMQGYDNQGNQYFDPVSNRNTNYCVPGDPVNKVGWYEGDGWPDGFKPGDRYYLVSSGPFNFAPGDTQTVIYAIMINRGSDRLSSVTKLKELAEDTRQFYLSDFDPEFLTGVENNQLLPEKLILYNNFPNPFNPTTKIKYAIPSMNDKNENAINVKLEIYDLLGRRISTLLNKRQKPGIYEIIFDASQLSSGIYFYKITADKYFITKKMILLK